MRGKVQRRIVVYSNDMEHNAVALSIVAHIQPELQVEPARFEIVPPSEGGEQHVELEVVNLSDRELEQLSVRTTVEILEPGKSVPHTLAPGERLSLSYRIKHPSHGDEEISLRSGYIIVEAHGYGRILERIPVLLQSPPEKD